MQAYMYVILQPVINVILYLCNPLVLLIPVVHNLDLIHLIVNLYINVKIQTGRVKMNGASHAKYTKL